jgi:hypothetical protein
MNRIIGVPLLVGALSPDCPLPCPREENGESKDGTGIVLIPISIPISISISISISIPISISISISILISISISTPVQTMI